MMLNEGHRNMIKYMKGQVIMQFRHFLSSAESCNVWLERKRIDTLLTDLSVKSSIEIIGASLHQLLPFRTGPDFRLVRHQEVERQNRLFLFYQSRIQETPPTTAESRNLF